MWYSILSSFPSSTLSISSFSLQAFKVSAIKPGYFMVPFYVMFPIAVSRSSL